jgi:hypothetical protein
MVGLGDGGSACGPRTPCSLFLERMFLTDGRTCCTRVVIQSHPLLSPPPPPRSAVHVTSRMSCLPLPPPPSPTPRCTTGKLC